MIDLKLDNRGDLVLEEPKKLPRLCVGFRMATYPTLNIQFVQGVGGRFQADSANALNIQFHTAGKEEDWKKESSVSCVYGKDELKQRVMTWLRTENGEVKLRQALGSNLQYYKHKDIMDDSVSQGIASLLQKELEGLLDNARVEVTHETYEGNFYSQNINVRVYSGDELAYSITI